MVSRKKASKRKQPRNAKQEAFLASYSRCGNIGIAARLAKCGRSTHYEWLTEERYAARFAEAHQEACDAVVAEIRRRAMEGAKKPVYQGGKRVGFIQEYSDTLLIFLAKALMPEIFRERYEHRHGGHDGGPLTLRIVEEIIDADVGQDNPTA